jgi:hypothetical protein
MHLRKNRALAFSRQLRGRHAPQLGLFRLVQPFMNPLRSHPLLSFCRRGPGVLCFRANRAVAVGVPKKQQVACVGLCAHVELCEERFAAFFGVL